jgi:hypothetical protein
MSAARLFGRFGSQLRPSRRTIDRESGVTGAYVDHMHKRRKPSPEKIAFMLGQVGGRAYQMTDGWVRFLLDHDLQAGQGSDTAMRALIEFLVGRAKGRWPSDFRPTDAHPHWHVDEAEAKHLRERMPYLDQYQAAPDPCPGRAVQGPRATLGRHGGAGAAAHTQVRRRDQGPPCPRAARRAAGQR